MMNKIRPIVSMSMPSVPKKSTREIPGVACNKNISSNSWWLVYI